MNIYALGDKSPMLPVSGEYYVAPGAFVVGDVILGHDASVWFGAVIRGDNDPISIGAQSNVQDCAVLHSDIGVPLRIGSRVTIGHHAMVHSCDVGDGSLIGIGAVILGRAVIGKHCLVGAGALVTEGKSFPDGVLIVGAPARVVRPLTEAELAMLEASADIYVENGRRFRTSLRAVT